MHRTLLANPRLAQSIGVVQQLAQGDPLGAQVTARVDVVLVAANLADARPFDLDPQAAHRLAQIARKEALHRLLSPNLAQGFRSYPEH